MDASVGLESLDGSKIIFKKRLTGQDQLQILNSGFIQIIYIICNKKGVLTFCADIIIQEVLVRGEIKYIFKYRLGSPFSLKGSKKYDLTSGNEYANHFNYIYTNINDNCLWIWYQAVNKRKMKIDISTKHKKILLLNPLEIQQIKRLRSRHRNG